MTRRDLFAATAAAAFPQLLQAGVTRSKMGIATTSYMTVRKFRDTYEFLENCNTLGAAGIQSAINGDVRKLRKRAEELNMYIEAIAGMPHGDDASAFENAVENAKAAGALCVRVNAGGRRYEDFTTLADYQAFANRSKASLKTAVGICERHKIPFALENHKDWTLDQMVPLLKSYSSEYLGACLDFGNNIALLDDPLDVAEQLAPFAITTHVKDMGVEPYEDGFLLSELPLGEGFLDLPRMFSLVHEARPRTNFNLEMITRDPLKVPCFTDRYWATFPDRSGLHLARTFRLVRDHTKHEPLPRLSQLPHDEQLRVEAENVKSCLQYAHQKLNM